MNDQDSRSDAALSRRQTLKLAAGAGGLLLAGRWGVAANATPSPSVAIQEIDRQIIFPGRKAGYCRWSPRACMFPAFQGMQALMTMQGIMGSDYFGDPHFSISKDQGATWSEPEPIPGFGRVPASDGLDVSVCDVVPEYHPSSGQIIAIGHNVFYSGKAFARKQPARWPVYTTRTAEGTWTGARRLDWDDPRGNDIYSCNCAQRVTLENGDLLVPFSFGQTGRTWRSVTTMRLSLDGSRLTISQVGSELTNTVRRGFLEPSLLRYGDRFYLTIRAEDERGYVAMSEDGLNWDKPEPWVWDNGEPLSMSTTQQHWLPHSEGLFLVYTRKTEANQHVARWRSPLFVAQVDLNTRRLIRETEQTVLPLLDEGPKRVAYSGNFHTNIATPEESWVTDGETRPFGDWSGDTYLARIVWNRPNRLAMKPPV